MMTNQTPAEAAPRPARGEYPKLGVASGDPTATGVVLWTRLVPEPFEPGGGVPSRRLTVQWQVAADERFRRVVRQGRAWAPPELGHSVHVEVDGLASDRECFYRFGYRHDLSPTGRTRTAPGGHARTGALTFAFASCQVWDNGYHPSYRHMAGEDLDRSQYEGDIGALRAAAYQAWYEHQPVRAPARPDADGPRVYRRLRWGGLAQLDVVDLGSNVMLARLDHDGPAGDLLGHDAPESTLASFVVENGQPGARRGS
jgi:phosphodiesterase/alkaline phosphatase D-like protein